MPRHENKFRATNAGNFAIINKKKKKEKKEKTCSGMET
jgi:hypothetical protein